jgi:hypothetical protein
MLRTLSAVGLVAGSEPGATPAIGTRYPIRNWLGRCTTEFVHPFGVMMREDGEPGVALAGSLYPRLHSVTPPG